MLPVGHEDLERFIVNEWFYHINILKSGIGNRTVNIESAKKKAGYQSI